MDNIFIVILLGVLEIITLKNADSLSNYTTSIQNIKGFKKH